MVLVSIAGPWMAPVVRGGGFVKVNFDATGKSEPTWEGRGSLHIVLRDSESDVVVFDRVIQAGVFDMVKNKTRRFSQEWFVPVLDRLAVGSMTAAVAKVGVGPIGESEALSFTVEPESLSDVEMVGALPSPGGPDYMYVTAWEAPDSLREGDRVELAWDVVDNDYSPDDVRRARVEIEGGREEELKAENLGLWEMAYTTRNIMDEQLEDAMHDHVTVYMRVVVENPAGERIYRQIYKGPEEDIVKGGRETMFLEFDLEPGIPPGKMIFKYVMKGVDGDQGGTREKFIQWSTSFPDPTREARELMLTTFNSTVAALRENPLTAALADLGRGLGETATWILFDHWGKELFGVNYKGELEEPGPLDHFSVAMDLLPVGFLIPTGITDDILRAAFKRSPDAAQGVGLALNRIAGVADDAVVRVLDESVLIKAAQLHDLPVSEIRRLMKLSVDLKDEAVEAIYKRSQGGQTGILREIFAGRGIDVSETIIKTAMESKELSQSMLKILTTSFKTAMASKQVSKARDIWGIIKKFGTKYLKVEGGVLFVAFMFEELLQGLGWTISEAKKVGDWDHAEALNEAYGGVAEYLQFYSDIGGQYLPIVGPVVKEWADGSKLIYEFHKKEIDKKVTGGVPPGTSETMMGKVREVIDGDTLRVFMNEPNIGTYEIRVVGTNTPETGEPFKKEASDTMSAKVYGQDVVLLTDESNLVDQYGRVLAVIKFEDRDIGLEMIKEGLAFYYPYRPHKAVDDAIYSKAEEDAKFAKLKIWQGQTGKIKAFSKPTRAAYIIDRVSYGVTGAMSSEIPIGTYELTLRLPGYLDLVVPDSVEVRSGETTVLPGTYEMIVSDEVVPGEPEDEQVRVSIDSDPTNAPLWIDGIYTGHWTISNERELADVKYLLTPGPHTLRVTKTGKSAELDVVWTTGQNPPNFLILGQPPKEGEEPAPPGSMGRLEVISQPANARVSIDGVYTGHITPSVGDELDPMAPGTYQLRIERKGYLYDEPVEIVEGGTTRVSVVLGEFFEGEIPTPGVSAGRLEVYSLPERARIWVDGLYVHHLTPAPKGELEPLTPGPHTIFIEKGGYDIVQDTVVINAGKVTFWGTPQQPIIMPPETIDGITPLPEPEPVPLTLDSFILSLSAAEVDLIKETLLSGEFGRRREFAADISFGV